MSAYVAKHLDGRQKAWNAATQERIATITASLGGIKSLKMMGMEDAIESRVSQLRDNELRMSEHLRWILVAYNASGMSYFSLLILILMSSSKCSWDICSGIDSNCLRHVVSTWGIACK